MKTAIYIEDGVTQLVITPETEFEKNSLNTFDGKEMNCKLFTGSFYDCRGGWVCQNSYYAGNMFGTLGGTSKDDSSLIITLRERETNE
ncbi:hypothetical protein LCGC14_1009390 [marine sediment metagenome]|uniref:Uncharacterized protein n=1 Tax=marine sediment metagenome TaxID=412755 RepID=A0A0F9N0S6_9ZZZZ|nr:hypothetical protein [Candidatus Aminicenantes bacterium]